MVDIIIKSITGKNEWEAFIRQYAGANFLQSWHWGVFHQSLGNTIYRTGFYRDHRLIGIMLSIVERALRATYLTVPGGPLINWDDENSIASFVQEIRRQAYENKAVFVRVRPQLIKNKFSHTLFKKYGFIKAPMHLHAELTSQLDITKPKEQLLTDMRKTTRYEIKKTIKQGIHIIASKEKHHIEELYDAQIYTARYQHFTPFSYEYLSKQFEAFSKTGSAIIYKAEINKTPLSYALIIFYAKEAVYHYGATTQEGRKYGGAYLIQWTAILKAKRRGIKWYNFWGISPDNQTNRFYKLSLFKRGFGGEEIHYLPAQDLIISYPLYAINFTTETMRRLFRRL